MEQLIVQFNNLFIEQLKIAIECNGQKELDHYSIINCSERAEKFDLMFDQFFNELAKKDNKNFRYKFSCDIQDACNLFGFTKINGKHAVLYQYKLIHRIDIAMDTHPLFYNLN